MGSLTTNISSEAIRGETVTAEVNGNATIYLNGVALRPTTGTTSSGVDRQDLTRRDHDLGVLIDDNRSRCIDRGILSRA